MKPSDLHLLKSKYPLSESTIARNTVAGGEGHRSAASIQEQQNAHHGQAENKPQKPSLDESCTGTHRISIIIQISDRRERDGDGCESTLLDCLCHARERLLQLPDSMLLALYESAKKAGWGANPNHTNKP